MLTGSGLEFTGVGLDNLPPKQVAKSNAWTWEAAVPREAETMAGRKRQRASALQRSRSDRPTLL